MCMYMCVCTHPCVHRYVHARIHVPAGMSVHASMYMHICAHVVIFFPKPWIKHYYSVVQRRKWRLRVKWLVLGLMGGLNPSRSDSEAHAHRDVCQERPKEKQEAELRSWVQVPCSADGSTQWGICSLRGAWLCMIYAAGYSMSHACKKPQFISAHIKWELHSPAVSVGDAGAQSHLLQLTSISCTRSNNPSLRPPGRQLPQCQAYTCSWTESSQDWILCAEPVLYR